MTNSQLMFLIAAILSTPLLDIKGLPPHDEEGALFKFLFNLLLIIGTLIMGVVFHFQNV